MRPAATLGLALVLAAVPGSSRKAAAGESVAGSPAVERRSPSSFDWLWLSAGTGYRRVALRTLSVDPEALRAEVIASSASGIAPSVGFGIRLPFLTLGAHASATYFVGDAPVLVGERAGGDGGEAGALWELGAELGFRAPLGRWHPHLLFGAGWSKLGDAGDVMDEVGVGLDAHGLHLRAGAGLDYFLTPRLSVGPRASVAALAFSRDGVPVRLLLQPKRISTLAEARERLADADGSSVGSAWELSLRLGLHF